MKPDSFPADQGFRMPAEWEPHAGTWLTWPHNPETWPGQDLAAIEKSYVTMIQSLISGEAVNVLIPSKDYAPRIRASLGTPSVNLNLYSISTNDSWIRDYGPNFLVREPGEVAANLWKFDSWGGKYEWELDDQAGATIMGNLKMPHFEPGIVLEGGGIEVNGRGLCLSTEQCLLNPNRNGGLNKSEMEAYLKAYLGISEVIWCQGELVGDDTDGHIDNLVRFVSLDTVLCAWEEDPADPNHACLQENLKILEAYRDARGNPLNILKLPMPEPVISQQGRLPASYANFYIGNHSILVPAFNQPDDDKATSLLKQCFPKREVVGIPSVSLIEGLGGVHCLTQQEPLGC